MAPDVVAAVLADAVALAAGDDDAAEEADAVSLRAADCEADTVVVTVVVADAVGRPLELTAALELAKVEPLDEPLAYDVDEVVAVAQSVIDGVTMLVPEVLADVDADVKLDALPDAHAVEDALPHVDGLAVALTQDDALPVSVELAESLRCADALKDAELVALAVTRPDVE